MNNESKKFLDSKPIQEKDEFVDPSQDIEQYVLSLGVINKDHSEFSRVVSLITYYLRTRKYSLTEEVIIGIIENEKKDDNVRVHF